MTETKEYIYKKPDIEEIFLFFGDKEDGKIGTHQIGNAIRAMGFNPTATEIRYLCRNLSHGQRIGKEEFLPILREADYFRIKETAEDFIEGLKFFDPNGTGKIHSIMLRHILTKVGEALTDDEVDILLVDQVDSSGYVDYEHFIRMIMSG
ncbi:myosin-2 essential light chain-like [Centruroides sculpturatus]|uniref:myosin-2 essential light chain-like n=1 Tax=Centruroides sculpturatus TaxID=218467 RepID=UPI000C6E3157|nr:myosin-2 essential light chain-like [Centruroides sculpturatus]